MPVFGLKSTFLKLSTLVFQERDLIIEEVHILVVNTRQMKGEISSVMEMSATECWMAFGDALQQDLQF